MKGRIVILSGPSGVGKDTLIDAWHAANPRVKRVVAYTTRPPREGEVDGVAYHFVTEPEFHAKAERGDFLEWKRVHGNCYATPLSDLETMLAQGLIAILKIDVQGALAAMEKRPDALSVFILPPSWDELERRIRARDLDSAEVIEERLRNARAEMALADRYAHRIVNDDVDRAVAQLDSLVV